MNIKYRLSFKTRNYPIPRLFLLSISIVGIATVFILSMHMFFTLRNIYKSELRQSQSMLLDHRKEELKIHVDYILRLIERERKASSGIQDTETAAEFQQDIKQSVLNDISAIRYGQNGYIFIIDTTGTTLMNNGQSYMVGHSITHLTDMDGRQIFDTDSVHDLDSEGKFITYNWIKPDGTEPATKISYVRPYHPWGWIIGTGMYLDELDRDSNILQKEFYRRISRSAALLLLVASVLAAAAFLFARQIYRRLARNLKKFTDYFSSSERNPAALKGFYYREFQDIARSVRELETKRIRAEQKFRTAFKSSPDAVNINRLQDGMYIEINEGFTRLTGYSEEDVKGKTSLDINIWDDYKDREKLVQALKRDGFISNLEARFRRKDGSVTTALMSARVLQLDSEPAILSITRDIQSLVEAEAERKKLESQLRQMQKLDSIGQLTGGIAHDFNNILVALYGFTDLAMDHADMDSPVMEALQQIQQVNDRAKNLVSQLLAFSRKDIITPRILEVNSYLKDLNKMMLRLIGEDIEIRLDLSKDEIRIMADSVQFEQLVINCVVNARDALRDISSAGRSPLIKISTKACTADMIRKAGVPSIDSDCLCLQIGDNGRGMDADTLERIFIPFFTTKQEGKGTGLGLSTVYGIVSQNGGWIKADSKPGEGSVFSVYWPLTEDQAQTEEDRILSTDDMRGHESILYAEDDPMVREVTTLSLQNRGYTVITAVDGSEAIEKAVETGNRFQLLITDMTMPKLGGWELYNALKQKRPDLKVIFTSGYVDSPSFHSAITEKKHHFLAKPFKISDLSRMVRDVLDQTVR